MRRHHALLHREDSSKSRSIEPSAQVTLLGRRSTPTVLSDIALVHIIDIAGSCQKVRALIDLASLISAITLNYCTRLGIRPLRLTMPVTGLAGQAAPDIKGAIQLQIQTRDNRFTSLFTQVWTLPTIT